MPNNFSESASSQSAGPLQGSPSKAAPAIARGLLQRLALSLHLKPATRDRQDDSVFGREDDGLSLRSS